MKAVLSITLILVFLVVAAAQSSSELSGYVTYTDRRPASGAVVTVGNFSVTTDANGYYKLGFVRPGMRTVLITPQGRATRSFTVNVGTGPTKQNFVVNW
jgi:hypothetical protein